MLKTNLQKKIIFSLFFPLLLTCQISDKKKEKQLFIPLTQAHTGIGFLNEVKNTKRFNIIDYLYFYNGGGVAAGDINNDGLVDLFFTANLKENKLYLNKGNLQFEDITEKAGISKNSDWNTGTVMVDINGDGWLDIYICAVMGINNFDGRNELYINNQDNTFTEEAEKYGLDIKAYSSNATFFDYDKDGDLDMYLLNHAVHTQDSYTPKNKTRAKYSYASADKLFRNDGDSFTDVSKQAGLIGGIISYGLGVNTADFNHDGWDDIYVSNDFHENDYFYINQKDGTFKEQAEKYFAHTSNFSMGNDAADINNDGYIDLLVLDMLPEDEKVLKSSVGDSPYDIYQYRLKYGYGYQFSRNVLQLNNQGKSFSEIALMTGVAATDWSWSPLFEDYDNDSFLDLFVATGIMKRPNDLDYIKFISNEQMQKSMAKSHFFDEKALNEMPEGKVNNYIFKGNGKFFTPKHKQWGMKDANISTGSAIADLDNDGDMDIIVNCINEPSIIYKNTTNKVNTNYLQITLKGKASNPFGIGTKIYVFTGKKILYKQCNPYRGFQSSSQPIVHFGLGNNTPDSILVIWNDDTFEKIKHISPNKMLLIKQENAYGKYTYNNKKQIIPDIKFKNLSSTISFTHKENNYFDFNRNKLLQYGISTQGPAMAVADINGDKLDDVYFGGARGQAGALFVQKKGRFIKKIIPDFEKDKIYEDVDAVFIDIDNDEDNDLVVVTAGNEFRSKSKYLLDKVYINDGMGNFSKATDKLPKYFENTACIRPADIDKDGDIDLFIGGRVVASKFGKIPRSYVFINDGKGNYSEQQNKQLKKVGMVTDALWVDIDKDNDLDLIVVGEWMFPKIFQNTNGKLIDATDKFIQNKSLTGLWQEIALYDYDQDGDMDVLLGNWGLNTKWKASAEYPIKMFVKDIDNNGSIEQIVAYAKDGKYYPTHTKDELGKQLNLINKRFTTYKSFAGKTIKEIFTSKELKNADILKIETLASSYLENNNGKYIFKELPFSWQDAPIFAFYSYDFDTDNKQDLLFAGNLHQVTPYHGRFDANHGKLVLANKQIKSLSLEHFNFNFFNKEVRDIQTIRFQNSNCILIAINNGNPILLKVIK